MPSSDYLHLPIDTSSHAFLIKSNNHICFFASALYHSNINANIIVEGQTYRLTSATVGHVDFVSDF